MYDLSNKVDMVQMILEHCLAWHRWMLKQVQH